MSGYDEAPRSDDEAKNRLCPPANYGDSMAQWAGMNVRGARATAAFTAEPDIKAWADTVALNPSRTPPGHHGSPALDAARERLATYGPPGVRRLAELM